MDLATFLSFQPFVTAITEWEESAWREEPDDSNAKRLKRTNDEVEDGVSLIFRGSSCFVNELNQICSLTYGPDPFVLKTEMYLRDGNVFVQWYNEDSSKWTSCRIQKIGYTNDD